MKINHYINNRIAAAMMLLLSLFLLPACSNEEDVPVVEPEQPQCIEHNRIRMFANIGQLAVSA